MIDNFSLIKNSLYIIDVPHWKLMDFKYCINELEQKQYKLPFLFSSSTTSQLPYPQQIRKQAMPTSIIT